MADESYKQTFNEIKAQLQKQKRSQKDIDKIERAFLWAEKLHAGQYRISQEPYIIHPLEVAKILTDLKLDTDTIVAAFLHDILEDTDTTADDMREKFGSDVLNLVQGVTKLSKYQLYLHLQYYQQTNLNSSLLRLLLLLQVKRRQASRKL